MLTASSLRLLAFAFSALACFLHPVASLSTSGDVEVEKVIFYTAILGRCVQQHRGLRASSRRARDGSPVTVSNLFTETPPEYPSPGEDILCKTISYSFYKMTYGTPDCQARFWNGKARPSVSACVAVARDLGYCTMYFCKVKNRFDKYM